MLCLAQRQNKTKQECRVSKIFDDPRALKSLFEVGVFVLKYKSVSGQKSIYIIYTPLDGAELNGPCRYHSLLLEIRRKLTFEIIIL